jgi:hypothetical protein
MIRTLESSSQVLKLRFGGNPFDGCRCRLDRGTGMADISWLVLGIPVRNASVSLSKISRASMQRMRGHTNYNPTLEVRGARSIAMTGLSKSEATEVARLMRDFLASPEAEHAQDSSGGNSTDMPDLSEVA